MSFFVISRSNTFLSNLPDYESTDANAPPRYSFTEERPQRPQAVARPFEDGSRPLSRVFSSDVPLQTFGQSRPANAAQTRPQPQLSQAIYQDYGHGYDGAGAGRRPSRLTRVKSQCPSLFRCSPVKVVVFVVLAGVAIYGTVRGVQSNVDRDGNENDGGGEVIGTYTKRTMPQTIGAAVRATGTPTSVLPSYTGAVVGAPVWVNR